LVNIFKGWRCCW